MTKLLVSVRDAAEAVIACNAGAAVIDVKEPARGSLGAADGEVIEAVVGAVRGRVPVSVAMGELGDGVLLASHLAGRVAYAKFGLAGCGDWPEGIARWQAAIGRLPRGVVPVAVAYADWHHAAAPHPRAVLERAWQVGCGAILLDTFDKARGPLTRHIDQDELLGYIRAAGAGGLVSVVAGGLDINEIPQVVALSPDYVAVRGAACAGDRSGPLDEARVRRLAALVRRPARGVARPASAETKGRRVVARAGRQFRDQFA